MKLNLVSLASAAMTFLAACGQFATAQTVTYAGRAAAVSANVLGVVNATVSDTGALPSSGGALSNQLAVFNVPELLNVNLLSAATQGANDTTHSHALVASLGLIVAGIGISASVLSSDATANCQLGAASDSGSSVVADLTVNGMSVTVTGAPNQTVPLLLGSLVINEQVSTVSNSPSDASATMLVNALHLRVIGVADVAISSSMAGIACQQLQRQ